MASYGRGGFGGFDDSSGSIGYQGSRGAMTAGNDFSRLQAGISSNIQRIAQNVSKCEKLVSQVGTSQDTKSLTAELQQLQHATNEMVKSTNSQLKDLAEIVRNSPPNEKRQRDLQKQRLADEFTRTLNHVQRVQREAADKERESVRRARAHSGNSNPFADTDQYGNDLDDEFLRGRDAPKSSMQAVIEEEENLTAIREREEALKSLESDIMDVNTIFKDLGQLVHEQGEVIDSIESNVESAQVNVESANTQLEAAAQYQSSARRKKCICAIIVVVALIIIVLVIVLPLVTKNKNS